VPTARHDMALVQCIQDVCLHHMCVMYYTWDLIRSPAAMHHQQSLSFPDPLVPFEQQQVCKKCAKAFSLTAFPPSPCGRALYSPPGLCHPLLHLLPPPAAPHSLPLHPGPYPWCRQLQRHCLWGADSAPGAQHAAADQVCAPAPHALRHTVPRGCAALWAEGSAAGQPHGSGGWKAASWGRGHAVALCKQTVAARQQCWPTLWHRWVACHGFPFHALGCLGVRG
jgi:hypothetical protein